MPAVENFYGIGNNTVDTQASATYYTTVSDRFYGSAGLSRDIGKSHHTEFGIFYQSVKVTDNNLITDHSASSIFSGKQFAGVEAGYKFNNSNSNYYPTKGIHFAAGGGYVQNIKDKSRSFFKASSSFSFYVPLGNSFSLAIRAGGATLTGEADYYHLNTLGGNENLRGYSRERFFGKNTFYNNNDLRWVTDTKNYFFAGKIGLLVFYDNGRVWQPGENSNLWHSGYGGGLIIIPFNKAALTGTYGTSKEGAQILLQTQIFF
jgi:hemolysin activation/secretion protein